MPIQKNIIYKKVKSKATGWILLGVGTTLAVVGRATTVAIANKKFICRRTIVLR
jgi:hypothetical protein